MKTNREERKAQAVEFMMMLGIYGPYINEFIEHDKVCVFERFIGFEIGKEEAELRDKLREIEQERNCTVYAITHETFGFGECYSLLIVTDEDSDWDKLISGIGDKHRCYAYVWNKDDDWRSDFGFVSIQSFGGGIERV